MDRFLEDSWRVLDDEWIAASLAVRRSLDLFEKVDLEEVMYLLEKLATLERDDPLATPFLPRAKSKINGLKDLPETDTINKQAQEARLELRRTIFEKCTDYDTDTSAETYGRLLKALHQFCQPERIYIATTNYDRIIESLWEGREEGLHTSTPSLELQTGFHPPAYGNPTLDIERGYTEPGDESDGVIHLIKLHGSLGWRQYQQGRVEDTGAREFTEEDAVLAYPVRSDKSEESPFSKLYKAFDSALTHANVILIVGMSLRDQAIVERIAEALRTGNKLALILDPEPQEVRNQLPSSVRKYVVPQQGYFGPKNVALSTVEEWRGLLNAAAEKWIQAS